MVVCDGLTGLPDAISAVWPQTITQACVVHYADLRINLKFESGSYAGQRYRASEVGILR